jgi:type II secretory ATPase GspE/PulE/Tfp pilus assembly ATPase PilB-like protein
MLNIVEDALMKAAQGLTSIEEVFALVDRAQQ